MRVDDFGSYLVGRRRFGQQARGEGPGDGGGYLG